MTYTKTEPKANFSKLENEVLEFWRKDDTFHKSLNKTKLGHPFSFYDGPPFANGLPHWGHLGVSAIKDMVSRFHTMQGHHVERELGWDCHGLPAESSVEKKQDDPVTNCCEIIITVTSIWAWFQRSISEQYPKQVEQSY